VAVRSKASGRQTATLEVWGGRANETPTASPEATLVKRRASTAGKEQRHRVSFADTSMPTSVLAQISGREISR